MIQRIQTLFLIVAFAASMLLFFFPFASIYSGDGLAYYKFYVYGFKNMSPDAGSMFTFMTTFPLLLINILVAGASLGSIFLYKNRIRQMKVVRITIFLQIILIGLVLFVYNKIIEKNLQVTPDYQDEFAIYFPLISLVFLVLANRFILKDEKLVRSVDRLR
jgi:hypothetical protein